MRYSFSGLTILHGFFQDPHFHCPPARQTLKFPNLFQCLSKLRYRSYIFPGSSGNGSDLLILPLPLKQQTGLNTMQTSHMWDILDPLSAE